MPGKVISPYKQVPETKADRKLLHASIVLPRSLHKGIR